MAFSDETIQKVWEKAKFVDSGNEARGFRKDQCGAWIQRSKYGNRKSSFGWEIDHITPTSAGGSNALSNLRPLQWNNNASRGDGRLQCVVVSNGTNNVDNR